jgi:hypothetical protein
MKQYILALRSLDFTKSGKSWSTDGLDLYNNKFYTNYSISRSRFGVDEIGDKTFVGTEIIADATPTIIVNGATPVAVTNYGEIVKETGIVTYNRFNYDSISGQYFIFNLIEDASPYYILDPESVDLDLYRFVDTTSKVDILNYKGAFTNVNAEDEPTFTIKVYESDDQYGPWMLSSVSSEVGTLFIQNAKRYLKLEIEIDSNLEPADVENFGFVLLVEVAIEEPSPPVLSKSAKNILNRFPSWMRMYEDSIDQATQNNYIPQTVGGKFINALVAEHPENFEKQKNFYELDRSITTADENQLAWIYSTSNVLPSHLNVSGDSVTLVKVNTIEDLYEARENDYCYYYNSIDKEIITIKLFKTLTVDGSINQQNPALRWNWFDEYGTRVGLKRLYLESNANFKLRILDVYKNLPSVNEENFKVTLRRELDIWSAYGSTPDSDYLGATPEIIEIEDMENSTPYFDFSGKALKPFKDFVKDINQKYPVNWGYVKWDNGYWDYAGQDQAAIGRIPAVYDDSSSPFGNYYQPGVGDAEDARLLVKEPIDNDINFAAKFRAYGIHKLSTTLEYSPIEVNYEYYGSYIEDAYDNPPATVNIRYALNIPSYGTPATPTTFYSDITAYPFNSYGPSLPASPEYTLVKIFNSDGYSLDKYVFKNLKDNTIYIDPNATPSNGKINFYSITKASATPMSGSNSFNLMFADGATPTKTVGSPVNSSSPFYSITAADVKVSSNTYNKIRRTGFTTPKIPGKVVLNSVNDNALTSAVDLDKDFIHNSIIFPPGSTPLYVHIDNVKPFGYQEYENEVYISPTYDGYGGYSRNENLDLDYLIPSSPNIRASYVNPNFATPDQHFGYINTTSSTVNYHFAQLKYPYLTKPDYIRLSTSSSSVYPFVVQEWETFTAETDPMIDGTVNEYGLVRTDPDNKDNNFTRNSNVVGSYDLTYDDFGIDVDNYVIQKIEPVNDFEGVELTTSSQFVYKNNNEEIFLKNAVIEDVDANLKGIEVSAQYVARYDSFLRTGWYSQNEEEYYIYSNPLHEIHTTPGFTTDLTEVARQGAPIIINRNSSTPVQLREVAFYNPATPTYISIINTEVVKANASNNLYLGYSNVYDINVVDNITGYTVMSNGFTSTNEIEAFSAATPSVKDREYTVNYKVKDSFAVDNDHYNLSYEKYVSKIIFDSTPSGNYSYNVVYESSITGKSTPVSLTVDPTLLWDQEGFIYLSHNDYHFSSADVELNPNYILDNTNDIMSVTINSLDINGNSKPYQTFRITGPYVTANEEYITTDINGFAHTVLHYNGSIPSATPGGYVLVQGVVNGSGNAHENSETQGYSKALNFDIVTNYENRNSIKAIVDSPVIYADGVGQQYIRGRIISPSTPISNNIVYWRKGRTVSDVFHATPYSSYVTTNELGEFTVGPITAQDSKNPGYWIVAVESEHSTSFESNPTTVSGDIVYWAEKYDNLNYHISNSVIYNPNVLLGKSTPMYSTPNFTVKYNDGSDSGASIVEPNWIPPKWYPLNRFDQYQMGLFGSTPDVVQTYNKLINDYEED